jgi:hypothetical protein
MAETWRRGLEAPSQIDALGRLDDDQASSRLGLAPSRGSVAMALIGSHPGCDHHARRDLARFSRLAVARGGLWWEWALEVRPSDLTAEDARYVVATWTQFLSGERPFRRRSVRAA